MIKHLSIGICFLFCIEVVSVFCRIWQFQVGMAAFYCGSWITEKTKKTPGSGDQETLLGENVELQENDEGDFVLKEVSYSLAL